MQNCAPLPQHSPQGSVSGGDHCPLLQAGLGKHALCLRSGCMECERWGFSDFPLNGGWWTNIQLLLHLTHAGPSPSLGCRTLRLGGQCLSPVPSALVDTEGHFPAPWSAGPRSACSDRSWYDQQRGWLEGPRGKLVTPVEASVYHDGVLPS